MLTSSLFSPWLFILTGKFANLMSKTCFSMACPQLVSVISFPSFLFVNAHLGCGGVITKYSRSFSTSAMHVYVTSRPGRDHFPGPLHHRSTILSALGLPFPHGFVFGNSRATSQWVTHHGIALAPFSLNFGVPTEPEASELPKGLVLGRDGNIHLRITPLGDVGCHSLCRREF
ncbi:S ribonuclease [Pyrus ussuriensis x Pyrus communis]|uniref:S ribonuclease n=1 Tax=Pyrus ussuriensis x Pyrus communis TaxID=2448454 RepID=A0A5N5H0B4_9ROSA|nr:S ribonuclease [Pyrus ussuriensis x Pyrus communis]